MKSTIEISGKIFQSDTFSVPKIRGKRKIGRGLLVRQSSSAKREFQSFHFFMFLITSLKLEEYHSHLSLIHVLVIQAHTHSLTHTHNLNNKIRYEADDKQVEEPFEIS